MGARADAVSQQRQAVFVDSLRKLGWNEGNCLIHDRWTSDEAEHMRLAASELVGLRPDVIFTSPIIHLYREAIAALAVRYRLPTAYAFRFYADSGGLVSYGVDPAEQAR